jgi:glyoxylase-like metal-dependent hydrolase (beta-lactamase superfamily II)
MPEPETRTDSVIERLVLSNSINDVNGYLLDLDGECFVVDPGGERDRLVDHVRRRGLEVVGILLTHAHIDHIGALDAFDVPVYLHEEEIPLLRDRIANGSVLFRQPLPYRVEDLDLVTVRDGAAIPFDEGMARIRVLHTPGHTRGGLCFRFGDDLLTGDTLFQSAVGRWDFPTGSREDLARSVVALIDGLDDDVRLHPGHGDSSTIGEERIANAYYLRWKRETAEGLPEKADP